MAKKIFIAATMQNDGKTTVSLGLIAALKKRFGRIGFIKPIGQRYLIEQGYKIDEDSVLVEEVFGIKCNIKDMSPVAIEKGFTERYIEKGADEDYAKLILESYEKIASENDLVIIEGTGHAGVGSVFNLSNATVAKLLGANMLLISSGGVGKPIDEISLNKALIDREGVTLAGAIINKVHSQKYEKVKRIVKMGLEQKGINLFGVLPYQKALAVPTMREINDELDIETLFHGESWDTPTENILIGAMNVKDALSYVEPNTLMIIPGDRDDMIDAVCRIHLSKLKKGCRISGIILTGGLAPSRDSMTDLERSGIPTLVTEDDTYRIASKVHSINVKLKPQDKDKIKIIVDMIEEHIDIDAVVGSLR